MKRIITVFTLMTLTIAALFLANQTLLLAKRHVVETATVSVAVLLLIGVVAAFLGRAVRERNTARQKEAQAQEAWTNLTDSQERTVDMQKATARMLLLKARRLIEEQQWDEALKTAVQAVELDSGKELPYARYLRGRLEAGNLKFTKAITSLREAREMDVEGVGRLAYQLSIVLSRHKAVAQEQGGWLSREQSVMLAEEIAEVGDPAVAVRTLQVLRDNSEDRDERLRLAEQQVRIANPDEPNLQWRLSENAEDGSLALDLSGNRRLKTILSLRNLPLVELSLARTHVTDLSPLQKMPLRRLDLSP